MDKQFQNLPVCEYLPEICRKVQTHHGCILRAAPGAGKTMLVPVALKDVLPGRILLMEPRRIAAKGAAAGIAAMQQWQLGREVGFKVRGETMASDETGIVAATCGMVLSMLQNDPALTGFDAVIFDEFHERGAEQELVFALLDEVRSALREDLNIVIMSATLDENISNKLAGLPEICVPGREFPVEINYRPVSGNFYELPNECAKAVLQVFNTSPGDILLFLPGKNEIDRCGALLENVLDNAEIMKLHGALSIAEQSRVLKPAAPGRRKVVLATNIAESSLTIDGITNVIDSGYERRMHFAPGMGMPVLEACRISVASAVQRAGRAGRTAPGRALRLWTKQDELGFPDQLPPEIVRCDLCRTVLEIARWGSDPEELNWLTAPPDSAVKVAVSTLQKLGLLDECCRITASGRRVAALPLHPRLGAMLIYAEKHNCLPLACEIAAVIEEGTFLKGRRNTSCDLLEVLAECRRDINRMPGFKQTLARLQEFFHCRNCRRDDSMAGVLVARAYPEYIGRARKLHGTTYQLSGGRTAVIREEDPLRKEEFLAIAALQITAGRDAVVGLACAVSLAEITEEFQNEFTEERELTFDENSGRVSGVKICKFGSMTISTALFVPDAALVGRAVLESALHRKIELFSPSGSAARLLGRVRFARKCGDETMPDWDDETFRKILPELSEPYLAGVKDFNSLKSLNWLDILKNSLDYSLLNTLNITCPDKYLTPAGQEIAIDYSGEQPTLSVPIQQLYGETIHPCVGKNHLPLRLELLSPARRPVQITCDLPGFWRGSWSLVRTEMRSRYPKHEWPEHPETVAARRSSVKKR